MKAYTLRVQNEVLDALKHISLKEHKTMRGILLELIEKKISSHSAHSEKMEEQKEMERVAHLMRKMPIGKVVKIIRGEREK